MPKGGRHVYQHVQIHPQGCELPALYRVCEKAGLSWRASAWLPVKHCVQGSHGWALYGKTAQALADCGAKGIDKPAFGIDCGDPTVLAVLPERADRIELVGLVSNICVVSNAVVLQSRYPEARIVVDAALTASFDPKLHGEVLDVLEGLQVEVLNRA